MCLREVSKKQKASIISRLTFLWDIGATDSMIKRQHTRSYERNMCSNKLEYSTSLGPYFTTYDVKVPFFVPEISIRNIISHRFYVDNYEGK